MPSYPYSLLPVLSTGKDRGLEWIQLELELELEFGLFL